MNRIQIRNDDGVLLWEKQLVSENDYLRLDDLTVLDFLIKEWMEFRKDHRKRIIEI